MRFSALQRAEIAEIDRIERALQRSNTVSVLFNEPKLLKLGGVEMVDKCLTDVSVLFNEPKLLKSRAYYPLLRLVQIVSVLFNEPKLLKCIERFRGDSIRVSVLFNEPKLLKSLPALRVGRELVCFSALQRAEIAEIPNGLRFRMSITAVSVLFNEPKLLKFRLRLLRTAQLFQFQCSSTSRNC